MLALRRPVPADVPSPSPAAPRARRLTADVVTLGFGIAVVLVHAAAVAPTASLWIDEAYTLGAINDLGLSLTSTHGTMGLYYALLWPWGQISTAAWWIRTPSVLAAVATLVVVRSVARRIGGRDLATVAVPLLALLPVFEWKAVEARSYSLTTLLVAGCWYCGVRAVDATATEDERRRWWLLVAPLAVAGSLTHGLFSIHLAPLAALALLGPAPAVALRRLAPALVGAAATAGALAAWGASNVGTHTSGGPADWVRFTYWRLLPGDPLVCLLLLLAVVAGAAASVRGAVRAGDAAARARLSVPVLWAAGPCAALIALSLVAPRFNPRYLAPSTPGLALCLGVAACLVASRVGAPRRSLALLGTTAVLAVLLLATFATSARTPDQDWRSAAAVVADGARPGDGLLFANLEVDEVQQHRPPFEAAWTASSRPVTPVVLSSPRPLGRVLRWERSLRTPDELAAVAADVPRVWVVGDGSQGAAGPDAVVDAAGLGDMVEVGSWTFTGGIEVRLLARTP